MAETKVRRVLRPSTVLERVPLDASTLWRMEKRGDFPQRIKLGGNATGWYEDEIIEWQDTRERGSYSKPFLVRNNRKK